MRAFVCALATPLAAVAQSFPDRPIRVIVGVPAGGTPDGYTLLVSSPGPLAILLHMHRQPGYEPLKDFTPIGLIASNPFLLITHPSVPAESVKELLAPAKTPKPVLAKLSDAFAQVMGAPEMRSALETQGAEPGHASSADFAALIRREYEKYAKVVEFP